MIQTNDRIKAEENLRKEDEGIEIEEDENALPYYGRIKLPQSDNSISINVTEDNTILEFYISPLGIRSRERGSDKESKLFNKNSYITMEMVRKLRWKILYSMEITGNLMIQIHMKYILLRNLLI